jgi:hypothetical protein
MAIGTQNADEIDLSRPDEFSSVTTLNVSDVGKET